MSLGYWLHVIGIGVSSEPPGASGTQFLLTQFREHFNGRLVRMRFLFEALVLYLISPTNATWIAKCLQIGCSCMYGRENYPYKSLLQVLFLREAACGLNNLVSNEEMSTYNRHLLVDIPEEINLLKMTNMDFASLRSTHSEEVLIGYNSRDSDSSREFEVTSTGKYDKVLALELRDLDLRIDNNSTLNFIRIFTKLEIIDLSNNRISAIKKTTFMKMPNLRVINLNNNMIVSIDQDAFQHLSQLTVLQLSKNSLITVPSNIPTTLQVLTLAENRFGHFTINLHFPRLTYLDLCGNFLSKSDLIILNDVKFLRRICLGDNGVGMPANLNVKSPYLRNITLSALFQMHALLDNATIEELNQFLSLRELSLIHFHINTLSFLANKTQLVNLRLEHMTWNGTETNVTKYFERKDALNRISLDQSPTLATLLLIKSRAIVNLKNLTYLSLQFTGIKTLSPESLPRLTRLQLDISFNALICDEHLQWIMETRSRQPNFLMAEDVTICATPEEKKLVDELHVISTTMTTSTSTSPTTSTTTSRKSVTTSLATPEPKISSRPEVPPIFHAEASSVYLPQGGAGAWGSSIVLSAIVGVLSAGLTAFIIVYVLNKKAKTRFDLLRGYSQDMTALVE